MKILVLLPELIFGLAAANSVGLSVRPGDVHADFPHAGMEFRHA